MTRQMKDSGVDWIGEIPENWEISRLKFFSKIQTGNQDTQDNDPNGKYPFYVRSPIIENSNKFTFEGPAILMSGDGAGAGRIFHYVDGKYGCHQRVYSIQNIINLNRKFLFYYLQRLFINVLETENAKSTVDSVRLPMLKDIPIILCELSEQQKIADFLDKKCSEIDSVLTKTRESIEEYKKLKQSIITQAVTKGIRPNRKMKDSGIEWTKEIPDDWNSINPKSLFTQRKEKAIAGEKQLTASQQYGIIYQDEYMELTGAKVVTVEKDFDILKHVEKGDFVISMRSFQGGLEYSTKTGSISSAYVMLIPNEKYVFPRFYRWLLKSNVYINALQSTSNLVRDGQAMRYSNFAQVRLFTVPLKEQKEIADYLDLKCTQIDKVIEQKEALLDELEKYKKSLIYEYVTGKKEVK